MQILDARQLIVQRGLAQFAEDRRLEGVPAAKAAPVVQPPDQEAFLRVEHVALDDVEDVGGAVAVGDHLQAGAAVPVDDHRVLAGRVEVLRLDELGVQVGPVVRLDRHELAGDLGQRQARARRPRPAPLRRSHPSCTICVIGGVSTSEN